MLGIYPNLSNEDYHAHDSISRSKLMDFAVSPYNFWAMHLNPDRPKKEATKAMDFGTAFHELMLQPDLFNENYVTEPKKVLLKDVGRDLYEAYKAYAESLESSDKIVLSFSDHLTLLNMNDALRSNAQALDLIEGAIYEQSYFWQDKESGLLVKARPDIKHENMIVDLKTCANASPAAMARAMVDWGYHLQMAMMRDGIRELEGRDIPNCILLCIEKTYPYAIGIYIIDEEALEIGRLKYLELLKSLKHCIVNNEFPGLEPQSIGLPGWAK